MAKFYIKLMDKKKNLFEIAKENAKVRQCDGCHEIKPISSFKKTNKYCTGCKYVEEIREQYKNKPQIDVATAQDIEDFNWDDFFKDL